MKVRTQFITPEMAKKYLQKSHIRKRPINVARMNELIRVMVNGEWFKGNDVIFDESGHLIDVQLVDGQHRPLAITESGMVQDVQSGSCRG